MSACGKCGYENRSSDKFCGECGAIINSAPKTKRTMMLGDSPVLPTKTPQGGVLRSKSTTDPGALSSRQRRSSQSSPPAEGSSPATPPASETSTPKKSTQKRTAMIGAVDAQALKQAKSMPRSRTKTDPGRHSSVPPAAQPARSTRKGSAKHTMLGVSAQDLSAASKTGAGSAVSSIPKNNAGSAVTQGSSPPPSPSSRQPPRSGATESGPVVARAKDNAPVIEAQTKRTMLGVPLAPTSDPPPADIDFDDHTVLQPPPRPSRWPYILIALVLMGGGAYFAYTYFWKLPPPEMKIVNGPENDFLELAIDGVADGTIVGALGQTGQVEGGKVRLVLGNDALKLGQNSFLLKVGDREQEVSLSLTHWIRIDHEALRSSPVEPAILIDSEREVTVDGKKIELDENGHARLTFEAPVGDFSSPAAWEKRVTLAISGGQSKDGTGGASEEVVVLRIPYAQARLRAPGASFTTDRKNIDVVVRADEDTSVSIAAAEGGDPVALTFEDGVYTGLLGLPKRRRYAYTLKASKPASLDREGTFEVERVLSLRKAAGRFGAQSLPPYTLLEKEKLKPGKKVRAGGKVFQSTIKAGRTVVQILSDGCEGDEQCPLWIEYPQPITLENGSQIEVYGLTAGVQKYQTSAKVERKDPKLDAVFIFKKRKR